MPFGTYFCSCAWFRGPACSVGVFPSLKPQAGHPLYKTVPLHLCHTLHCLSDSSDCISNLPCRYAQRQSPLLTDAPSPSPPSLLLPCLTPTLTSRTSTCDGGAGNRRPRVWSLLEWIPWTGIVRRQLTSIPPSIDLSGTGLHRRRDYKAGSENGTALQRIHTNMYNIKARRDTRAETGEEDPSILLNGQGNG
ncbi:hypothetical protein B0T10DRAFT_242109 [Thelonectria olida]|uniref:Uncharacterized protein n=1 Tax=Thelonectria olida TaxID=1576542 RepID=A0A9P9AST1_9HYPO|nr:hypothetical protein B0T10DRAFT_242109 [Thelonectria olida]